MVRNKSGEMHTPISKLFNELQSEILHELIDEEKRGELTDKHFRKIEYIGGKEVFEKYKKFSPQEKVQDKEMRR